MHIKKYKLKYNVFVIVCFYQAGKKKKKKSLMMLLLWQLGRDECTPALAAEVQDGASFFAGWPSKGIQHAGIKTRGQLHTARCQSEQTEKGNTSGVQPWGEGAGMTAPTG